MDIAILGGTGDLGGGLALRFAFYSDHDVLLGSRDPDRAREKAEEFETELASRGREVNVGGFGNPEAAGRADVVVLAVPASEAVGALESIADRIGDSILVSPAVRLRRDEDGVHVDAPAGGSVLARVADAAPDGVPVVGAYHGLSADRLANLDVDLAQDTVLVGDDGDAKDTIGMLTGAIEGLGTVDAGGLANAPEVESLAALLENVGDHTDGLHDVGVTFH